MTQHTDAFLHGVLLKVEQAPDLLARAALLTTEIESLSDVTHMLANARRSALMEMRHTMSVAEIAEAVGLSAARVYALLAGERDQPA